MSTENNIESVIKDQIDNNPIILYMKGNPNQPQWLFCPGYTDVNGLWPKVCLCRYPQ